MNPSLLIIERPGSFRDALVSELQLSGASVEVRGDAMEALASLDALTPDVVLVSEDPGPPGASSLCRLVRRQRDKASVLRLGDPSQRDPIDTESSFLPRALGPSAIVQLLLARGEPLRAANETSHRVWDAPLGALELGPLLLAIGERWATGRLILSAQSGERELFFARGMLVGSRSSVFTERLGVLGVQSGVLTKAQLETALDAARRDEQRIGEALIATGALDAAGVFALLSAQLSEQVAAACNGGACHARFLLDDSVLTAGSLLRLHPLTALFGAVGRTPKEDVSRVLEQLAERALSAEAVPGLVLRWLADVGIAEPQRLLGSMSTVRHLRERLRERLPKASNAEPERADTLALALLRLGALRLPGRPSLVPADLRVGLTTLSPPSVASAVVRCARATFDGWPVSPLPAPRTAFEEQLDVYLHGERARDRAQLAAQRGPSAESEELDGELLELQLRAAGARPPWSFLQLPPGATQRERRLACYAVHEHLDARPEPRSALEALRVAEVRLRLDVALAQLGEDAPDAVSESSHPASTPAGSFSAAPPAGRPPSMRPGSLAPIAPIAVRRTASDGGDAELLALVEPMVQQSRWNELRDALLCRLEAGQLPPAFVLLYAVALKEAVGAEPANPDAKRADPDALGIAAVSELLAVPPGSATALVVAKRILRRRPIEWTRKASGRVSLVLVLLALFCGAGVGLLLQPQLMNLFMK